MFCRNLNRPPPDRLLLLPPWLLLIPALESMEAKKKEPPKKVRKQSVLWVYKWLMTLSVVKWFSGLQIELACKNVYVYVGW